jgi:hypothetical protein
MKISTAAELHARSANAPTNQSGQVIAAKVALEDDT